MRKDILKVAHLMKYLQIMEFGLEFLFVKIFGMEALPKRFVRAK